MAILGSFKLNFLIFLDKVFTYLSPEEIENMKIEEGKKLEKFSSDNLILDSDEESGDSDFYNTQKGKHFFF